MPPKYIPRRAIIPIGPSIAYIPLTKGYYSLIDSEDAHIAETRNWYAAVCPRTVYARRSPSTYLHALIFGDNGPDHINCNGLDNRRANLRAATSRQNGYNQRRPTTNTTGFKGVCFYSGRFRAHIIIDGRNKHLGGFFTAEDAYAAYCKAAQETRGEFMRG